MCSLSNISTKAEAEGFWTAWGFAAMFWPKTWRLLDKLGINNLSVHRSRRLSHVFACLIPRCLKAAMDMPTPVLPVFMQPVSVVVNQLCLQESLTRTIVRFSLQVGWLKNVWINIWATCVEYCAKLSRCLLQNDVWILDSVIQEVDTYGIFRKMYTLCLEMSKMSRHKLTPRYDDWQMSNALCIFMYDFVWEFPAYV